MSGRRRGAAGGTALHQRITADLAAQIRSGAWPPGHRIPFEHELMARYGCARATAGKAVQALAAEGLISRRRRAGSFVARPPMQSAVLEIPELQAVAAGRGQSYGYELIAAERRAPDPTRPDEAPLADAGELLSLTCRHFAGGAPFAFEERLISLTAVPEAGAADFAREAPGAWLLHHVPWTEAEHRIGALAADAAIAGRLDLAPGAACLNLRRWTWRAGEAVTFVRQVFPAESLEVTARFSPRAFG
jgi:GntR family histidine utilization transcriptional repressor